MNQSSIPKPGILASESIPLQVRNKSFLSGNYLAQVAKTIENLSVANQDKLNQIADRFYFTWRARGRIIFAGNGGNAANASHSGLDIFKRTRIDNMPFVFGLALTDSTPSLTALGNDEGFDRTFVAQAETMRLSEHDTVVCLSGSGNSPNILALAEYANQCGATLVGISGFETGGKLATMAKIALVIPHEYLSTLNLGSVMAGTEDATMAILHEQFEILRERIELAKRDV